MKLSLVTINFNKANGLKNTIDSVANQTIFRSCINVAGSLEFEHIIVDGGSKDGSFDIIRDYEKKHHTLYSIHWVSESDTGIYNAMNKGIIMATGDYVQILNAGDVLANDNVYMMIINKLKETKNLMGTYPELLYGNMLSLNGKVCVQGSRDVPYSLLNYYRGTLNHNCCWIKRTLFDQYGLYDEKYKIVSDWKWFLQVIGLGSVKPYYLDIDMTIFEGGGISSMQIDLRDKERRHVLTDILPPAVLADYDKYALDMEQMDNLRQYPFAYKLVWIFERVLNKLNKHNLRKR